MDFFTGAACQFLYAKVGADSYEWFILRLSDL
jgi:hypothetical protein